MATFYYVTATAPASIFLGGKYIQLAPGQSHGPFSEQEVNLVLASPDRRRLVLTKEERPERPADLHQATEAPTYTSPTTTPDAVFSDMDTVFQQESVKVVADDVPTGISVMQEEAALQPTSDPKANTWEDDIKEEDTTSSMTLLPDAAELEEKDEAEPAEDGKPKSRRRRKTP